MYFYGKRRRERGEEQLKNGEEKQGKEQEKGKSKGQTEGIAEGKEVAKDRKWLKEQ